MIRKPNWVIMGQDGGISIIMERALESRLVGTLFIRPKEFAGPVPIKKLDFRASIFFRFSFSSLLIQHKTQSFIFTLAFVFSSEFQWQVLEGKLEERGNSITYPLACRGRLRTVAVGSRRNFLVDISPPARPKGSCSKHRTLVA